MSVLVCVAIDASMQFFTGPLDIFTPETQEIILHKCPTDIIYNDHSQNPSFEEEIANATINLDKEGRSKLKPIAGNKILYREIYLVGMHVISN